MGETTKENGEIAAPYVKNVYMKVPYNIFAPVVVSLPLLSLFICFITSVLYKFDQVNETVCGVSNFIPSISAITGSTPQCYIWRICIALHSTPRLAIAFMYYNYWLSFPANAVTSLKPGKFTSSFSTSPSTGYHILLVVNLVLNLIENMSLVGVTYISNVENYPLHEKIFIAFMVTSCAYMFATLMVYRMAQRYRPLTLTEQKSHRLKKAFFATIMFCTLGLLYFFYKHRVLCEPNAFSWFSACEYGIAVTNMGFHLTAAFDFEGCTFLAAPSSHSLLPPPPGQLTSSVGASGEGVYRADNEEVESEGTGLRKRFK